jgi:CheY-like chemotaxis protein
MQQDFASQTLLLVEDNSADVFIFNRVARKALIENPIQVARDGQEAVDYLAGNGKFADRSQFPLPGLILLDLKLPLKDGFEVLQWMRKEPALASIPVVILTSSSEPRDTERARALGALCYLLKPPTPESLAELLEGLRISWQHASEDCPEASLI